MIGCPTSSIPQVAQQVYQKSKEKVTRMRVVESKLPTRRVVEAVDQTLSRIDLYVWLLVLLSRLLEYISKPAR